MHKQIKLSGDLNTLAGLCLTDSRRWFGDTNTTEDLGYMALAMAGEVGEFCNVVKKIERKSLDLSDAKTWLMLSSELTDVLVYLLNIAGMLHIDLEKSFMAVRGANEKRFMEEREKRNLK